jgi:hypothetical protein
MERELLLPPPVQPLTICLFIIGNSLSKRFLSIFRNPLTTRKIIEKPADSIDSCPKRYLLSRILDLFGGILLMNEITGDSGCGEHKEDNNKIPTTSLIIEK